MALLNKSNFRTIIEYFFNLVGVNMMLKRKFINYVSEPDKVFNLRSKDSHPNHGLAVYMSVAVVVVSHHQLAASYLEGCEDYSTVTSRGLRILFCECPCDTLLGPQPVLAGLYFLRLVR